MNWDGDNLPEGEWTPGEWSWGWFTLLVEEDPKEELGMEVERKPAPMIETKITERTHIVPRGDIREHDISPDCWCQPEYHEFEDLYLHHSADGREDFETGKRKPS